MQIDSSDLAAFQAGMRRRYSDDEILSELKECAERLGRSPTMREFEGDRSVHGWQITSSGFAECLDAVETGLAASKAEPEPDGARFRTGFGVAAGMHVISNRARSSRDLAQVRVRLAPDGALEVFSGEVDVGGGTDRMLARLIAGVLGVDPQAIRVVLGDSELCPYGLGSWASRTTFFAGNAALDAAHAFERVLIDLRTELGLGAEAPLEEVVLRARQAGRQCAPSRGAAWFVSRGLRH